MKKYIKAFTLIEVIIATTILSIAVFGVYKLIGENTKIIQNSDNYFKANSLLPSITNCIENIGFDTFKSIQQNNYNFNFGGSGTLCLTGTTNQIELDNINYELIGNITNSGANFIDWELKVNSEAIGTLTGSYKQIKK